MKTEPAFTFYGVTMKLDPRLSMTAGMARPGVPLADIGTDHAYLPVYLMENGIIPSAVASDIRPGPLRNAAKTVEKYSLQDRVKLVLTDGLTDIPRDCTDFCIAGMGGELIAKILGDSPWVQVPGNHFVLQPQTHPEDLRRFLWDSGFEILREDVVKDGRRFYLCLEAVYTGMKREYREPECYTGKVLESGSAYAKEYLKYIAARVEVKYKATGSESLKTIYDDIMEAAK